jgi:AraC family transcriptional regulator, regulatory protein of adaptative response / methylated-DNA-[protein]-cysteine methyltransferase
MEVLLSPSKMARAWQTRDADYDGVFFVAVTTTGIFCRPSCTARRPLERNVAYFATATAASAAGFRPCKRCRPLDTDGRPPPWVQTLLTELDMAPTARIDAKRLRRMGIDPARARRYFLRHYGMTFHDYCRGRQMSDALQQIRAGARLDDVRHGYESTSGFREAFQRTFGTPAGRGAQSEAVVVDWIESPVGPLVIGCRDNRICLLEFSDRDTLTTQLVAMRKRCGCPIVPGKHARLKQLQTELTEYFAGERTQFAVPLLFNGTEFQERVWNALLRVPYGSTCSYEDLARAVGVPNAQRAVGTANGCNRIAIVIPCHRVVNKGGKLGGYGGGLWRKQYLLELERAHGNGGTVNRSR